jgi:hypothetical protein
VTVTYILDPSAVVALFAAYRPLATMLAQTEAGRIRMVLTTTAMEEANRELKADSGAWDPVLSTPGVYTLPLSRPWRSRSAAGLASWPPSTSYTKPSASTAWP